MKRLLLPLLAALAFPYGVNANVDPKVVEMCMKAVDFKGCVETMSGGPVQKRMIIDQGVSLSEGNSCPYGYAYIGGGYCREVVCTHKGYANAEIIAGKLWKCKAYWGEQLMLRLGDQTRVQNKSTCPQGEPKIGWNSTCDAPYIEPYKQDRIFGSER